MPETVPPPEVGAAFAAGPIIILVVVAVVVMTVIGALGVLAQRRQRRQAQIDRQHHWTPLDRQTRH